MNENFRFLMYRSAEQDISVNAVIRDETVWLTQKAMAELFGVQTPAISKHLKNIFAEGELDENVVVSKMEITTQHGAIPDKTQTREALFYNLDAIISVGYRVNSRRATHFRIWATGVLKEYMTKGFALDDERLKQGRTAFGRDYFRELLERVRSIRASERRIWQQITDIFAECSLDYDRDAPLTHEFYAMVQNRFHYAITGQTAAEIIYTSADRHKEHMGLTTWKNAPDDRILKSDVAVAKNYLTEPQIRQLERAVTGYFDYIEDLIERENTFTMQEFSASVNEFLAFAVCNQAIDAIVEKFGYFPAWPIVDYTSEFILERMLSGQFHYWERESPPPLVNHEGRFQLCPRDAARCALERRKTQAASDGKRQFPLCSPDCLAAVQREEQRLYRATLNEERGRIRAEPLHRMLGLWLWDYCREHAAPPAEAMRALEERHFPQDNPHWQPPEGGAGKNLDWYDFREVTMTRPTLYADYQDACRCIEAAKFLPRLRGVKKTRNRLKSKAESKK